MFHIQKRKKKRKKKEKEKEKHGKHVKFFSVLIGSVQFLFIIIPYTLLFDSFSSFKFILVLSSSFFSSQKLHFWYLAGPLGTFWIPWSFWYPLIQWTFRYLLGTLTIQLPFGYLGPLCTFWIPQTFRYLFNTQELQIHIGNFGRIGTFGIPWTFRYLLHTLGLQVPLYTLDIQVPFGYLGPVGTSGIPWTFR